MVGLEGFDEPACGARLLGFGFIAAAASVVNINIGVNRYEGSFRSSLINAMPCILGMCKSVITSRKPKSLAFANPSKPSLA